MTKPPSRMLDFYLPVILFILLILLFRRLLTSLSNPTHPTRHSLPVHRLSRRVEVEPDWTVEWSRWSLSIYTTALNPVPRLLLVRWGEKGSARLRKLYNSGIAVGLLGAAAGMGGAIWAAGMVWVAVWDEVKVHAGDVPDESSGVGQILKRAVDRLGSSTEGAASTSGAGLQPLIPGVTVPFSHLPTLLLSLLINELIHELGHALAGALDDVVPSRLSFDLYFLLPSMTVTFPSSIDYLPPAANMRLIAAGPLHNLLTYGLLWSLAFSGMGKLFWRDEGARGVVVQSVYPASPLFDRFRPGDLITHLDDVFLGGPNDLWISYLSSDEVLDDGQGLCVHKDYYTHYPEAPCDENAGEVTLVPIDPNVASTTAGRCVPSSPLSGAWVTRCPCDDTDSICVHPLAIERALRIASSTGKFGEEVMIWFGRRTTVLHGVRVGKHDARVWRGGAQWGTMLLEYVSTLAFSLFLFNLLPLPHTDGSHLLRALLASYSSRLDPTPTQRPMRATLSNHPRINIFREYELNSDDEEDYEEEGMGRREEAWKRRVRRGIEGGSVGVCVIWAAGWGMLALLRSS